MSQPGPVRTAPPAPRPPDPDDVREASRRVLHFALLMLVALLTASRPLPWQAASLVFVVAAVVVGIRALVLVRRSRIKGAIVPVLAVGLVFAAAMATSLTLLLAMWPLQREREQCLRDALTISSREACEQTFNERVEESLTPGR